MTCTVRLACKCAVTFAAFEAVGSGRGGGRHGCEMGECVSQDARLEA